MTIGNWALKMTAKWKRDKGWVRDMNVNVYTDPSDKKSGPKNPLLKWKYDRFLFKRDRVSTVLYSSVT